jgi:hypothetical protein
MADDGQGWENALQSKAYCGEEQPNPFYYSGKWLPATHLLCYTLEHGDRLDTFPIMTLFLSSATTSWLCGCGFGAENSPLGMCKTSRLAIRSDCISKNDEGSDDTNTAAEA